MTQPFNAGTVTVYPDASLRSKTMVYLKLFMTLIVPQFFVLSIEKREANLRLRSHFFLSRSSPFSRKFALFAVKKPFAVRCFPFAVQPLEFWKITGLGLDFLKLLFIVTVLM